MYLKHVNTYCNLQWRGATRPKTESEWFQNPYCTAEQCKRISFTVFNRWVVMCEGEGGHGMAKCRYLAHTK